MKPTICIDFDGVIHSYEHGWRNGEIYGTVTKGFWEWADRMSKHFLLVVYSSRSKDIDKRGEMYRWMQHEWNVWYASIRGATSLSMSDFDFAHEKPSAFITIDDRCICFDGDWSKITADRVFNFKPWNK